MKGKHSAATAKKIAGLTPNEFKQRYPTTNDLMRLVVTFKPSLKSIYDKDGPETLYKRLKDADMLLGDGFAFDRLIDSAVAFDLEYLSAPLVIRY